MKIAFTKFNDRNGFYGISACTCCDGRGYTFKLINDKYDMEQCPQCRKMMKEAQVIERIGLHKNILKTVRSKKKVYMSELIGKHKRRHVVKTIDYLLFIGRIYAVSIGRDMLITSSEPNILYGISKR